MKVKTEHETLRGLRVRADLRAGFGPTTRQCAFKDFLPPNILKKLEVNALRVQYR